MIIRHNKHWGGWVILFMICFLFGGCIPEELELPTRLKSVTTDEPTNIAGKSATLHGKVHLTDTVAITCGIICGLSEKELTYSDAMKFSTTTTDGDYSVDISGLMTKTTYYYRAYAEDAGVCKYGEVRSFTTKAYSAQPVDLGLSVMWASCNVGADLPEEFGGLYAWGETEEKDYYYWDSYKWGSWYDYMNKYIVGKNPDGRPVDPDNKTILEPEDDVAHVTWGDLWYMPTFDEVSELFNVCTTEWTVVNGISGQKITAPNGNSIFLPAAGYRIDEEIKALNSECYYWSSSLKIGGYCNSAHSFFFSGATSSQINNGRCEGLSVRPIWRDRKDNITVITGDVTNINAYGATLSGVIGNSNRELTCGFIYGITSELSAEYSTMISTASKGEFSINVSGLEPNTTYYYCTYVVIDGEYRYGKVRAFVTESSCISYIVNGVSFNMITVAGGTFTMGSLVGDSEAYDDEMPAHKVTLSDFSIGETEVTQELWLAVMDSNPSKKTGDLQRPVESVNWADCQDFIWRLNDLTGEEFRLPTEAEWEYAARGGKESKGYKYSGSNDINEVAWYEKNYSSGGTKPVKTKQPNELGIYDMSGNVGEWCSDWHRYYSASAQTNPTGPSFGSDRVNRGGDYYSEVSRCRVAYRGNNPPNLTSYFIGLRLAR